jgi:predicted phosphodiesterase
MFNRRQFVGAIPASALAITAAGSTDGAAAVEEADGSDGDRPLIASPPVVQNPRPRSFGVSIAVSGLATAWVEYGFAKDDLRFTSVASHHGLIQADDRALHVRVNHAQDLPTDGPIYYRMVVQSLRYAGAYKLERAEPQATETFELRLASPAARSLRVVSINDTHENLPTIIKLHKQIEQLDPDLLIWNGDTCNDFDSHDAPEQILLNPAKDAKLGWASTRPLLFSNGNHDIRGVRAREVAKSFAGCPESQNLPYNQALRFGPLAVVTLDTGEDKPDRHPVFAGTAAYEPYRELQTGWLAQTVSQKVIRSAPFKIATTHIPLRGLEGGNDGTTLDGYAHHSGFGAGLWLPVLKDAGFQAVLSGHTHRHRVDEATPDMPIWQFVGGGPKPSQATVTIIDGKQDGESAELEIRIVDLDGVTRHQNKWST